MFEFSNGIRKIKGFHITNRSVVLRLLCTRKSTQTGLRLKRKIIYIYQRIQKKIPFGHLKNNTFIKKKYFFNSAIILNAHSVFNNFI